MNFVIIGNPENRRVKLYAEAVYKATAEPLHIIPYVELLAGKVVSKIPPHSILKIDSPGENYEVKKALIARGIAGNETDHQVALTAKEILTQPEDFGAIGYTQPWFAGFCCLLDDMQKMASLSHYVQIMNAPPDIKTMFDKIACQQHLQQQGVRVPRSLPPVDGYEALIEAMRRLHLAKVFIKPAHASSASGVIAFRKQGNKLEAVSSVEIVKKGAEVKLYNALKVRTYSQPEEVANLINRIIRERVLIEEWLPKETLHNLFFDIRVLVIAGRARHLVVRMSKQIITNLHLGNKRGNVPEFIEKIGVPKLEEINRLAEKTAASFPNSLYMGVDILLTAGTQQPIVLEVNAFGDLLPNLFHENETCYEAEVTAAIKNWNRVPC